MVIEDVVHHPASSKPTYLMQTAGCRLPHCSGELHYEWQGAEQRGGRVHGRSVRGLRAGQQTPTFTMSPQESLHHIPNLRTLRTTSALSLPNDDDAAAYAKLENATTNQITGGSSLFMMKILWSSNLLWAWAK
ncbi:hypothetical protein E2562_022568, partial [Oryza meyeriana var. granulata]